MHQRRRQCRPLTKAEIARLQDALGGAVDREYLAYWVAEAIEYAVGAVRCPNPRPARDALRKIERSSRKLLSSMNDSDAAYFLAARVDLGRF
jgi:hypothetical protein